MFCKLSFPPLWGGTRGFFLGYGGVFFCRGFGGNTPLKGDGSSEVWDPRPDFPRGFLFPVCTRLLLGLGTLTPAGPLSLGGRP